MTSNENKSTHAAIVAVTLLLLYTAQAFVTYPVVVAAIINGFLWMIYLVVIALFLFVAACYDSSDPEIVKMNRSIKETFAKTPFGFKSTRSIISIAWAAAMILVQAWALLVVYAVALGLTIYMRNKLLNTEF